MADHGNAFGAAERLGVVFPAPCLGHPLMGHLADCSAEGTILLSAVIEHEDGSPLPLLITVCPKHARAAEHWLTAHGRPDLVPVDRWATSTFFEHAHVFEESGIDWHVLERAS